MWMAGGGCRLGPNTDNRLSSAEGWPPRTCDDRTETVHQAHSVPEREGVHQLRRVHFPQPQPVWSRLQHRNLAAAVHQRLCVWFRRVGLDARRNRRAAADERISPATLAAVSVQQPPSSFLIHKVVG